VSKQENVKQFQQRFIHRYAFPVKTKM